jgi:hypothetical protein
MGPDPKVFDKIADTWHGSAGMSYLIHDKLR